MISKGKSTRGLPVEDKYEYEDDYDHSTDPNTERLLCLLKLLLHKKKSARVNALLEIIEAFNSTMQHDFSRDNFFTLMDGCIKFIQGGSDTENSLAAQILGLLALTLRSKDTEDGLGKANEIYRVSCYALFQQLKDRSQPSIKVLECLAVVTSAGSQNFLDTEQTMKDLWRFILPEDSDINGTSSTHSTPVLAAAISAWSYLLTTMDVMRLDHKFWQGVIPYFLELVKEDDAALNTAVIEAFALIFEMDKLDKFSSEANEYYSYQEFKGELAMELKEKCHPKQGAYILANKVIDTSLSIPGIELTLSTRFQLKKMSYLKNHLGKGFEMHLLENEFLHNMFQYEPQKDLSGEPEIYVAEVELRMLGSPNSRPSKARSKQMKEHRMRGQRRKTHHYLCEDDAEVGFTSNAAVPVLT